jgi:hypothetical protein
MFWETIVLLYPVITVVLPPRPCFLTFLSTAQPTRHFHDVSFRVVEVREDTGYLGARGSARGLIQR